MTMMNFTVAFNSNPECAGQGPIEPARDPYRTVQFVFFVAIAVFMLVTSAITLQRRRYRQRLRIRAVLPIIVGSIGGAVFIFARSYYTFIGMEFFPCTLSLSMYWMNLLAVVPDVISVTAFLLKQRKLSHGIEKQASKDLQEKTIVVSPSSKRQSTPILPRNSGVFVLSDIREAPSLQTFCQGLCNHILHHVEIVLDREFDSARFYEEKQQPSLLRQTIYDLVLTTILLLPVMIGLTIRARLVPSNRIENGCVGCIITWEDVLLKGAMGSILNLPGLFYIIRAKRKGTPDPLKYIRDVEINSVFFLVATVLTDLLLIFAPQVMREQRVDWHIFEMLFLVKIHMSRTVVPLYRAEKTHQIREQTLNLSDVLLNPEAEKLFEKHLIAEVSNENLMFYRSAVAFKEAFSAKSPKRPEIDALRIYNKYVSMRGEFPVNISNGVRKALQATFEKVASNMANRGEKDESVTPPDLTAAVFDEALQEVYRMMEKDAFRRFLKSKQFKTFLASEADLSGIQVPDPVPQQRDEISSTAV